MGSLCYTTNTWGDSDNKNNLDIPKQMIETHGIGFSTPSSLPILDTSHYPSQARSTPGYPVLPVHQENHSNCFHASVASNIDCQGESSNMSYCCALMNASGYVLVSDSRSSVKISESAKTYFDNFPKIVYLPLVHAGVIMSGVNMIQSMEIGRFIKSLDSSELADKNTKEICEHLFSRIPCHDLGGKIELCVAKASADMRPEFCYMTLPNATTNHYNDNRIWYSGVFDVFSKLFVEQHKDEIAGNMIEKNRCVNFSNMNLTTLIEFVESLVQTAICLAKFHIDAENTVGGSLQTLAVDCNGVIIKNTTLI